MNEVSKERKGPDDLWDLVPEGAGKLGTGKEIAAYEVQRERKMKGSSVCWVPVCAPYALYAPKVRYLTWHLGTLG